MEEFECINHDVRGLHDSQPASLRPVAIGLGFQPFEGHSGDSRGFTGFSVDFDVGIDAEFSHELLPFYDLLRFLLPLGLHRSFCAETHCTDVLLIDL